MADFPDATRLISGSEINNASKRFVGGVMASPTPR